MKLSIAIAKEAGEKAPIVMRGDYFQSIEACSKIGYPAIELHIRDPKEFDSDRGLSFCKEHTIGISSIGTGTGYGIDGLALAHRDEAIRKQAIQRIKDHIDLAEKFGAKVIVGLMRGLLKDNLSKKHFDIDLKKSLEACLAYAEKSQTMIVIEAINRYECDTYCSIAECSELIKDMNSKLLKTHIDTYHMNIEEDHIFENIVQAGDTIGHVHLADSNRWYPGAGHYNFTETVEALRSIEYSGFLAMECYYFPQQQIAAEKAFTTMKRVLG